MIPDRLRHTYGSHFTSNKRSFLIPFFIASPTASLVALCCHLYIRNNELSFMLHIIRESHCEEQYEKCTVWMKLKCTWSAKTSAVDWALRGIWKKCQGLNYS